MAGIVGRYLVGNTELLACVAEQGLNPISDGIEWGTERGEEIRSEEPFEARLTSVVEDEE